MPWIPSGSILLTSDWQYTEPITSGSFFRLKHTEARNGGLFAIAQAEVDADGKLYLIDSQVLAVEKNVSDAIKLPLPGCFSERRIAIKKLPTQSTLEDEIRRLFLPRVLQEYEQELLRTVSRSKWKVDVEVSDFEEPDYAVDLTPIQTKLDAISAKIDNLQQSGSGSTGATNTKTLTYASDGDSNGVCYWIGTNYGAEAWSNPHTANRRVTVTIVNPNPSSGDGSVIVNRSLSTANSGNALADPVNSVGIISIDLGLSNTLLCNYYSIRVRGDYADSFPRSWKLQGSNDNTVWVDLDTQSDNTSLASIGAWLSLPISNVSTGYRYFRIAVSDSTTVKGRCFLSQFEFYGTLTKV